MWDQLTSINLERFVPWVFFLAGMGGSLHCVGMCGGLVTSSCSQKGDVLRYQFGRGVGYLFLGGLAGGFGLLLDLKTLPMGLRLMPPIFLGGLFIFWGIQGLRRKKAELPLPKFLSHTYLRLWQRFVSGVSTRKKSFIIGLLSILLPCGMLYGVVLSTLAFQSFSLGMLAMLSFWLGTLPSMVIAPTLIKTVLAPLKLRLPQFYGTLLVLLGILTISFRINGELGNFHKKSSEQSCHSHRMK